MRTYKLSKNNNLVVSNIYRAKNKLAFFAMHQIVNKIPEIDIEFHILWHDSDYRDKWSDRIDNYGFNLVSYTIDDMHEYCLRMGIAQKKIDEFNKFFSIYFVIMAHYLRYNNITDYYLIYDDDIILNDEIGELKNCLINKIPVLISEPMNPSCDKILTEKLINLYKPVEYVIRLYESRNPNLMGFNAGFQGMSLEMYDDFLTKDKFSFLIDMFSYEGIHDADGNEIWGIERSKFETQQQSFFSTMNIIESSKKPHILNPDEYFVCPNWGTHPKYGDIDTGNKYEGWDINMKSKVIHFIGHTNDPSGYANGKSDVFMNEVNKYLVEVLV